MSSTAVFSLIIDLYYYSNETVSWAVNKAQFPKNKPIGKIKMCNFFIAIKLHIVCFINIYLSKSDF